jgi:hypothetical protein
MAGRETADDEWKWFISSPFIPNASSLFDGKYSAGKPDKRLVSRRPLADGERLAFPHPNSLKRAALLVDRIYMPCFTASWYESLPVELTFGDPDLDNRTAQSNWINNEIDMPWKIPDPRKRLDLLISLYLREPLIAYRATFPSATVLPVNYGVGSAMLMEGSDSAYHAVLNNVPAVVESSLSWDEVLEFRRDPEARRKYRDLHLWLNDALKATSEQHASDIIAQKLDDYRWAIRKHGLQTALEAVSSFVSLGSIIPPAAGLAAQAAQLNPWLGAAVGGALAVGSATAWLGKRLLDLKDVKRGTNREVAYLYDIQRLVDSK